jgi:hypothetical protein
MPAMHFASTGEIMSAFICTDAHLNVLVNYAVAKRASYYWNPNRVYISSENASEIGQILLDENYRSVNYRYRETDKPHAFKFKLSRGVNSLKPYNAVDT